MGSGSQRRPARAPRRGSDAARGRYVAGDDVIDATPGIRSGARSAGQRGSATGELERAAARAPREKHGRGPLRASRGLGKRGAAAAASPRLPDDSAPLWRPLRRGQRRWHSWVGAWATAGGRWVLGWARRIPPRSAWSWAIPLALAALATVWMLTGSYWQTRVVRIEGTNDPVIVAAAYAQPLTGCDAFRCDFSQAERALAALPRVQAVEIRVVYPDMTLVTVTPRTPVALWRVGGEGWLVGADGVIVASQAEAPQLAPRGLVVVSDSDGAGLGGVKPAPGRRMSALLVAMASQLRSSAQGSPLDAGTLTWTASEGFSMRATDAGAPKVVFGTPADAAATLADLTGKTTGAAVSRAGVEQGARAQVSVARALLTRLTSTGSDASLIDVRWGAHPYYR